MHEHGNACWSTSAPWSPGTTQCRRSIPFIPFIPFIPTASTDLVLLCLPPRSAPCCRGPAAAWLTDDKLIEPPCRLRPWRKSHSQTTAGVLPPFQPPEASHGSIVCCVLGASCVGGLPGPGCLGAFADVQPVQRLWWCQSLIARAVARQPAVATGPACIPMRPTQHVRMCPPVHPCDWASFEAPVAVAVLAAVPAAGRQMGHPQSLVLS